MNPFWVGVVVGGIVAPCLLLVTLFLLFRVGRVEGAR